MNILAINIGNSRTAAGWFSRGKIRRSARTETTTPVILEAVADDEIPEGICLCSVAPKRNQAWAQVVKKAFPKVPVLWVDSKLDFGIGVDLKRPEQTGNDRFANAVAGAELCGAPCIVCDFGTAATFNLVLPRRGFSGGVIAPGYGMWFAAMSGSTAQLPKLKPGGIMVAPVGKAGSQFLHRYVAEEGGTFRRESLIEVRFVPLVDGVAREG